MGVIKLSSTVLVKRYKVTSGGAGKCSAANNQTQVFVLQ